MTVEYIRTEYDNTIDLLLSENGTAIALTSVSKIMATFDESSGERQITSEDAAAGDITWAQSGYATGEIRMTLGRLDPRIEDGRYDVPIVIYASTFPNGIYMGSVDIDTPRAVSLALVSLPASAGSNTYCTLAEADVYHDGHLYASAWLEATSLQQKQGLIMATRLLDQLCNWKGYDYVETQALRWPRQLVYTLDGVKLDDDTIPQFLKNATAEFARHLIGEDRTVDATEDLSGFKRAKVGPLEIELWEPGQVAVAQKEVMPKSVWLIVRPYCQKLGRKTQLVRV